MAIERAITIARMRNAFREGISATRFIRSEREAGRPTYRRSDMLADWRTINQLETKKELLQYVRKDRYPTEKVMATVTWALSKEFMYVVKVKTQRSPDEPVLDHLINIMADTPLTPAMIEARVIEERAVKEKYFEEILIEVLPFSAVRRAI